jgi:hypothetical protein
VIHKKTHPLCQFGQLRPSNAGAIFHDCVRRLKVIDRQIASLVRRSYELAPDDLAQLGIERGILRLEGVYVNVLRVRRWAEYVIAHPEHLIA